MLKFLIVGILTISSLPVLGQQQACEAVLAEATDEFNAGHFYLIPSILESCLDKFSKEQRQRAYILLAQTYLLIDNPDGAKKSYLEILKANPEFTPDATSLPIDVVYLGEQFTAQPIFSFFIKAGTNVTPIKVIYDLNAYGNTDVVERYGLKAGYKGAIGGDFYIGKSFSIKGEVNYRTAFFTHSTENYFQSDNKDITERQRWLGMPIALSYYMKGNNYWPYAYVGFEADILLKDVMNFNLTKTFGDERTDTESPDIDVTSKRNRINSDILIGTGIRCKSGLNYLFFEIKYNIGLRNAVKASTLYGDYSYDPISENFIKSTGTIFTYAHVDDYYRVDNLEMSFGFVKPLYKPRELKRKSRIKK